MFQILAFSLLIAFTIGVDVCQRGICKCQQSRVDCANKNFVNLTDLDFPVGTTELNLADNKIKFDRIEDRIKLEQISTLQELNLNNNPLGTIPSLNLSQLRSLSLDGTSLSSIVFPSTFIHSSALKTLSLSHNRIGIINENDLKNLQTSRLDKLTIDDGNLETIDDNAFRYLTRLQSLRLRKNLLKSLKFISNLNILASINLDENQFISIPEEIMLPQNIKTFSFKTNLITTIDETSPLSVWQKKNLTNIKIFLTNNSFDCCQSEWFIHFLNTTTFVGDRSVLTCAKPADLIGRTLISLKPDEIRCGGKETPKKLWIIVMISIVGSIVLLLSVIGIVLLVLRRNQPRLGYTEIGGTDDPLPSGPVFPIYNDDDGDDDDQQTVITTHTGTGSVAPTIVDQL